MRYFDEYCELHLDHHTAPFNWVFRSDEKICIHFGVSLSKNPKIGQIAYQIHDQKGYSDSGRITAHSERILENGFKLFSVTLPPIGNGGDYKYRLGYIDDFGNEYTSRESRCILVCDEAPQSMTEIPATFLGFVDGKPLYGPLPKGETTPSPKSWQSRVFYSIIIDRFARSSQVNLAGLGRVKYDPASPYTSHGGTIRGVTEKIDYLKSLGVKVIILSPVYVNAPDGYHGYHPIHLLMVDPRLGTLNCVKELVKKAHDVDIYVILDVVNNHITDSINWEQYGGPPGGEFKYIQGDPEAVLPYPIEARNTCLFHGPEYTDMINQRLFGFLEDWRTETSYVRELLIQHLKYWIAETDVDGLRYDSARHIGLDFWQPCVEEIDRYAKFLGKNKFLQIAEHAGSNHAEVLEYNDAKFTNMIDYPTYYAVKRSFDNPHWLGGLADYFCGFLEPSEIYSGGWQNNLMFLDNQDTTRIFHQFLSRLGNAEEARIRLHFGLACLILGPQVPYMYQGTEQEYSGALGFHQKQETGETIGHDCYVREDMFENPGCVWIFGPINRQSFVSYSQDNPTFKIIHQLANIRFHHPLFYEGVRTLLFSRNNGLWCVLIHGDEGEKWLFVAMNLSGNSISEEDVKIPDWYGEFSGVNLLLATAGGGLHFTNGGMRILLPPFTFVLGELLRD
ncbi:alpha-amylase [Anabaena sp. FACHB-1237]|uniref:alpha-amylase family glycosyl hydrolase n=1 Tax=Anabaena sp. FACHB-1237 TaxID=2692769 RepID=UPI0016803BD5|nr:alpha-amylase family glycosyl hydrolase [Anabaena sp. FACHB-1237]MBD2136141.1 alpha-amylase [Anabaena sp. FACHB-1237]